MGILNNPAILRIRVPFQNFQAMEILNLERLGGILTTAACENVTVRFLPLVGMTHFPPKPVEPKNSVYRRCQFCLERYGPRARAPTAESTAASPDGHLALQR